MVLPGKGRVSPPHARTQPMPDGLEVRRSEPLQWLPARFSCGGSSALWSSGFGPGIPTAFVLPGRPGQWRKGIAILVLVSLPLALFLLPGKPAYGSLPPDLALTVCFGFMPLTVRLWVDRVSSAYREEAHG